MTEFPFFAAAPKVEHATGSPRPQRHETLLNVIGKFGAALNRDLCAPARWLKNTGLVSRDIRKVQS